MVFINDQKFACETCIKGHRSSTCTHSDRPLFSIKRKGRPATQCEHCRELRKTKRVHVKCICALKDSGAVVLSKNSVTGNSSDSDSSKVAITLPTIALSDGGSSHSDRSDSGCACGNGGECNCCTPKNLNAPTNKTSKCKPKLSQRESSTASESRHDKNPYATSSDFITSDITQHNSDPSNSYFQSIDPSHLNELGYDRHRSHVITRQQLIANHGPYAGAYQQHNIMRRVAPSSNDNFVSQQFINADTPLFQNQISFPPAPFPTACGCDDGCRCIGCVDHHWRGDNPHASNQCHQPNACSSCLDCTILSLPSDVPLDATTAPMDVYQAQSIDDWIQQISAATSTVAVDDTSTFSINENYNKSSDYSGLSSYVPSDWDVSQSLFDPYFDPATQFTGSQWQPPFDGPAFPLVQNLNMDLSYARRHPSSPSSVLSSDSFGDIYTGTQSFPFL